jgi:hypothetical protein
LPLNIVSFESFTRDEIAALLVTNFVDDDGKVLFLVVMARITDDIEQPIKIIDYADIWVVHTTHQHQQVATIRIQKAMDTNIKWAEDTGFKLFTE